MKVQADALASRIEALSGSSAALVGSLNDVVARTNAGVAGKGQLQGQQDLAPKIAKAVGKANATIYYMMIL